MVNWGIKKEEGVGAGWHDYNLSGHLKKNILRKIFLINKNFAIDPI